jgi:hypothetical protein
MGELMLSQILFALVLAVLVGAAMLFLKWMGKDM